MTATTGQTDEEAAIRAAEHQWATWDALFAEHRRLGAGPLATVESVKSAIEAWRRARCAAAAGLRPRSLSALVEEVEGMRLPGAVFRSLSRPVAVTLSDRAEPPVAVAPEAASWSKKYFVANPEASRALDTPAAVALLVGRLQVAARDPRGWQNVPDFDAALDAAYQCGLSEARGGGAGLSWTWMGLPASPEVLGEPAPGVPVIMESVRSDCRPSFAAAWLEVVQHLEAERLRAATYVAAMDAASVAPEAIRVAPAKDVYTPKEGDRTLGEVIDLYRSERAARYGDASTDRKYSHLFRALEEVIGRDKPVRAVTREDAAKVRDLLQNVPANASKYYPGRTLKEAAQRRAADGRRKMAPNTVRSYLANLTAVMNYAVEHGYAEKNVARGLAPEKKNSVRRRAFRPDELAKLFASLDTERRSDDPKFWVPAVALYTGARANEICQLRTDDIREIDGVAYLDISTFGEGGVAVAGKRLKTANSERCIPLHPELIAAGFLTFVEQKKKAGEARLFPSLKPGAGGDYSHEFSKWFGLHMGRIGLSKPELVFHSFRHGFRDAGRRVMAPEVLDALGGWATPGVGSRYGMRAGPGQVVENLEEVKKMNIGGGFKLGPPPEETS